MKIIQCFTYILSLLIVIQSNLHSQNNYTDVEYTIIAKGDNSPLDISVVCYNRYFNLEFLSPQFRQVNNLEGKPLKKMMLVEIFIGERDQGTTSILLNKVIENSSELIIDYELVKSDDKSNEENVNPFIIIQIPKSKKKVVFIENGVRMGAGQKFYIIN